MSKAHFFKDPDNIRTWIMVIHLADVNDSDGYFGSMAAISLSRTLQEQYGLDSTIKKVRLGDMSYLTLGRDPMFRVLVRFENDEDEDLFIIRSSDGLDV
jgi:hypothetical protein